MDFFKLRKIEEEDIQNIVVAAGGKLAVPDDSVEKEFNADFLLGEAVLELKLAEDEPLEKIERQKKLAALFAANQPGRPVLVLDPALLNEDGKRTYYRLLEGPIKKSVKKAAKQLTVTNNKNGGKLSRVLIAINNG